MLLLCYSLTYIMQTVKCSYHILWVVERVKSNVFMQSVALLKIC